MAEKTLSPEAQADLAQLAIGLANDPEIGLIVKKRISQLDPTKRFPEVDTADIRAEIRKEFETRDMNRQKDEALERQRQQRQSLISSGRFQEDDVKEIEKLMEKEGIANYDTAAKIFAADRKPATPTHEIKSRVWEMPKLNKENFNNIAQHSLSEAYRAVDEIRKRA